LASRLLPYDVFLALVGVLIGAVISGAISWHFYRHASDDLKDVHDRIVRMLQAISGGTEMKATQDEQGNILLTFFPVWVYSLNVGEYVFSEVGRSLRS
jgi:hypothetical protein